MKYRAYLNTRLILESDSIHECVKIIIDHVPDDETNGWNNFFKNNHGHIVNTKTVTIAWSSRLYNNGR